MQSQRVGGNLGVKELRNTSGAGESWGLDGASDEGDNWVGR